MKKWGVLKFVKLYLLHQQNPTPLVFFIFLVFRIICSQHQYHIYLHLFALFLLFFKNYNLLYILPSFIYTDNDVLSAFFFLTSVVSCNRKWKVYLFLFTIADSYFAAANTHDQFIAVVSIALCIVIYKNLIFQTSKDNLQYFMGFFMFTAFNAANLFANSLSIWPRVSSLVFIITMVGYLSQAIFEIRLKQIRELELQHIKNPRIMARYIDILLQDFKVGPLLDAKLQLHAKNCRFATCYCKIPKFQQKSEFYLRQMFQNFMKKLGSLGDQYLWEYYIQFYIKKGHLLTAYYYLVKWAPNSYFSLMSKLKCEAMVIEYLQKENNLNPYEKEYIYGLEYDQKCQYVSTKIHQILKMKISFWKEVANECLSLHKLQSLGGEIVTRMYELNEFYNYTIKQYEKYLFCFDSTILYGMYLISTTNFKDYAKGIIKSTSKLMEEVCVSERNASETFAIRAVVKNSKKCFIKHSIRNYKAEKDISSQLKLQQSHQNEFKLVIDAVSSGFCRMVNIPKQQLIGSQLNSLIPNCYKDVHNARMSEILDFNGDTIKELAPSKLPHSELKLLFKGFNDELFSGLVFIKYNVDIKQGVTFLSVIKKTPQKKCEALATFEGELMQKEKGFPCEIMNHSQVKKYLHQMHEVWKTTRTIKQQKFNLMINRANYEITISSPFAFLILDKQCLKNKTPPIHIQLLNQDNTKLKNSSYRANNADQQFKKMEMMINREQESSANSSKSVNSVVNIISNFSENNSVPVYKYIIVTFLLLLLCNISLNLTFNILPVLPWDNTVTVHNPITDNANLYLLEILQSKAMLNLQDSINYRKYRSILNDQTIDSFYSGSSFVNETISIFIDINQQLKNSLYSLCYNFSTLLWPNIQQRLDKNITIPNILKGVTYSNPQIETIGYRQAIILFTVDTSLIFNQMAYDGLLINALYNKVQGQIPELSVFPNKINSSFSSARTQQVIFGVIFMAVMVVLVVPMCLVLRRRFKSHQRVFDLLSSIECEDVTRQIQSLLYISNILNNYNESQETLKLNVLDYEANTINPKHTRPRERKPSVMNQLIMGLEKFDVLSSQVDSKKQDLSENILIRKLKNNTGEQMELCQTFICIKNQLFDQLSHQAQIKGRKRSGELDLTGSQFDEKKCVNFRHSAVYLLLLSFLPFMINALFINLSIIDYSNQAEYSINSAYNQILKFNKKLYQTKVYLWEGPSSLQATFNATTALSFLQPILAKMMYFSSLTNTETYTVPPNFYGTSKLSEYSTSLRVIQGEMTSIMKDLVQFRYKLQGGTGNGTINNVWIAENLYQQIFFLQSLNNQRQLIIKEMINDIQEDMFGFGISAMQNKKIGLVILLIWSVISFGIGLVVTFRMKRQFFKEVYILTFLNDEMLMKNKRVQSYLDSLSKNTYF